MGKVLGMLASLDGARFLLPVDPLPTEAVIQGQQAAEALALLLCQSPGCHAARKMP